MSIIHLPVPYQIETFGTRQRPARIGAAAPVVSGQNAAENQTMPRLHAPSQERSTMSAPVRPRRSPDFLVQLMIGNDAALRAQMGRQDRADQRESAYASALAARPSQQPVSIKREIAQI